MIREANNVAVSCVCVRSHPICDRTKLFYSPSTYSPSVLSLVISPSAAPRAWAAGVAGALADNAEEGSCGSGGESKETASALRGGGAAAAVGAASVAVATDTTPGCKHEGKDDVDDGNGDDDGASSWESFFPRVLCLPGDDRNSGGGGGGGSEDRAYHTYLRTYLVPVWQGVWDRLCGNPIAPVPADSGVGSDQIEYWVREKLLCNEYFVRGQKRDLFNGPVGQVAVEPQRVAAAWEAGRAVGGDPRRAEEAVALLEEMDPAVFGGRAGGHLLDAMGPVGLAPALARSALVAESAPALHALGRMVDSLAAAAVRSDDEESTDVGGTDASAAGGGVSGDGGGDGGSGGDGGDGGGGGSGEGVDTTASSLDAMETVLMSVLQTPDAEVCTRVCAAAALGSLGCCEHLEGKSGGGDARERVLWALLDVARTDAVADVRATAVHAVIRMVTNGVAGKEEVLEAVLGAVTEIRDSAGEERYVMAYAAEAVHRINHLRWGRGEEGEEEEEGDVGRGEGEGEGRADVKMKGKVRETPLLVRRCNAGDGWQSKGRRESVY